MRNHLSETFSGLVDRLFNQPRLRTIIIGTDARLRLLAAEIAGAGKPVSLIKLEDQDATQHRTSKGATVIHAATEDELVLARADAGIANCLVAATPDDERNLDLCRTARDKFQIPFVIARLRLLEGVTSWARLTDSGMVRVVWPEVARTILGDIIPNANLSRLMTATDQDQITDVEVLSPLFFGRTIADLSLDGCEVVALTRNGLPIDNFKAEGLQIRDVLTLVGPKVAINKARESFTSL